MRFQELNWYEIINQVYPKQLSCKKRVRPQKATVKKDVKSKVAAKKWL